MKIDPNSDDDLSAQIAAAIRDEIISGGLLVNARLPSEAELADHFGVSRPTVREALKRLAAQSLIRTQRGASGGAFVNKISFEELARPDMRLNAPVRLSQSNAAAPIIWPQCAPRSIANRSLA